MNSLKSEVRIIPTFREFLTEFKAFKCDSCEQYKGEDEKREAVRVDDGNDATVCVTCFFDHDKMRAYYRVCHVCEQAIEFPDQEDFEVTSNGDDAVHKFCKGCDPEWDYDEKD